MNRTTPAFCDYCSTIEGESELSRNKHRTTIEQIQDITFWTFTFSFQAGLLDTESDRHVWYYSYSSIHPYPPQCGGRLSVLGSVASRVASSPQVDHAAFTFGAFWRWTCRHLLILLNASIIIPWKLHYLWGLGVECLQPSLDFSGKLCVSSSCSSSSGSVQVSGRTCQWSTQTFDSGGTCWMEAPWLPTHLNMLADIPWWCPIINDLIMDVSVGQVLNGLQHLHLTLWQLSDVYYIIRGSLPWSVRWWWGNLSIYIKGLPAVLEGMGRLVCSTGLTNQYYLLLLN